MNPNPQNGKTVLSIAIFRYLALDKTGAEHKGVLEAGSKTQVFDELKKKGLYPVNALEQSFLSKDLNIDIVPKKPKPRELAVFCYQFAVILNAGVPVVRALQMLFEQTSNRLLRGAVNDTKQAIEKGETLADAMRINEKLFTPLLITLIEAGEASGGLANSLQRMAKQFERSAKIRALIHKATTYPVILCGIAVAMVVIMLVLVLPAFQEMFAQLDAELPAITRMVIAASDFLIVRWYVAFSLVLGAVMGAIYLRVTDFGQRFLGLAARKLPIIKRFSIQSGAASMARTLGTLLSSGINAMDALAITARSLRNIHFREAMESVRQDVAAGVSMSESVKRCHVFPPMVHQMIHIGEETGNIDDMLDKMATYYEEETEAASAALAVIVEPAIIVIMAILVGIIVVAMIAPMGAMYAAMDTM